ncbi:MAG: flagellar protein FlaG [Sterolibacterium sp.]|nr:flagellar protein FlaG [Sterolibacterium sp.]
MAINTIGNNGNSAPLLASQSSTPAVASPKTPMPAPQQPSSEQIRKAVESVKQMVNSTSANSLDFSIDEQSGKTVVRVTDSDTGEVIRQIPSKEMLEIARSLDQMQGMLLKQKA